MTTTLTALLAGTLLSCTTFGVYADDERRPTTGNPAISQGGSGNNASGSGDRDHGFHGERWQDHVSREPMWFIDLFSGVRTPSRNPNGHLTGSVNWWARENGVDELIRRIQFGYDQGARWFMINRPMGTPGNTHVPGASWLTMDERKRDELPEKLTDALLDVFDEPVHVVWFVGSDMRDPRDFAGWNEARSNEYYGVGESNNWRELVSSRVTIGGWLSTGASGLAIDHSAMPNERGHYIELFQQLSGAPFNLRIMGESYPTIYEGSRQTLDSNRSPLFDEEAIRAMPWVSAVDHIESRWPSHIPTDAFPVDTDETRLYAWFFNTSQIGTESQRIAAIHRHMDMGLIPITGDAVMFREALLRYRTESNSSEYRAPNNSDDGQKSRIVIRSSSARRSAAGSNATERTSVPDQELPERYQNSGTGIR